MEGQEQSKFEGWAIVEVFGHQTYAGYVTTQAFGQAVLFRVDVPPLPERERVTKTYEYGSDGGRIPPGSTVQESEVQGYTKLFGTGAIYSLTPCTEEFAVRAVEKMQSRPLQVVKFPERKALVVDFSAIDNADAGGVNVDAIPNDDADDEHDDGPEAGEPL